METIDMYFENHKMDKDSGVPMYKQLKQIIVAGINSEELARGDQLPSEKELMDIYGISRSTIRQCISELSVEDYVYRIHGKGTFISKRRFNMGFAVEIGAFTANVRAMGKTPRTELLGLKVQHASDMIAKNLEIAPDEKVINITRLRYIDESPVLWIDSYLPYRDNGFILTHDFEKESLYSIMADDPRTRVSKVTRSVFATAATGEQAQMFGIVEGYPMLATKTSARNFESIPVEYSLSISPGDKNEYSFTIEQR